MLGCGLLGPSFLLGTRLSFGFEGPLHRLVGKSLLLDLAQQDHLGLGLFLLRCEGETRGVGVGLLLFEVVALLAHLGHQRVVVVEIDEHGLRGDGAVDLGGEHVVRVADVDQERHRRTTRTDELAHGLLLEPGPRRGQLGFDLDEFVLGVGDREIESVDLGLGVEQGLRGRIGPIACRLDLLGRLLGRCQRRRGHCDRRRREHRRTHHDRDADAPSGGTANGAARTGR
ncbi:MAG: hypothetical protein ABJ314_05265 [Ilumatobacter sp.]|uniref:hypothetical protein n=1 Tax=Ilumatobacter sp. TaxID=1967498 RepID=UPI003296C194